MKPFSGKSCQKCLCDTDLLRVDAYTMYLLHSGARLPERCVGVAFVNVWMESNPDQLKKTDFRTVVHPLGTPPPGVPI